jgi:hypothetical protein
MRWSADVREELVAQSFAFGCTCHQAGDIDEFDDCILYPLRLDDGRQCGQARIRYFDYADIRFDGAKRIIFGRDAGFRERVEEGRFADVRQADDTALKTHGGVLCKYVKLARYFTGCG